MIEEVKIHRTLKVIIDGRQVIGEAKPMERFY